MVYVTGPYMHEQWSEDVRDTIIFKIDLFYEIDDSYCVERNYYPWVEVTF